MEDKTLRALIGIGSITLTEAMLWSLSFFRGMDGAIIAGIGALAALVAGLGGYVAIRRNGS